MRRIIAGTLVSTVTPCFAIAANIRSGVGFSGKSTAFPPTAKGNIRFVPVA